MDFQLITLDQMPQRMVPVHTVRQAFEACTPYDCPSRTAFARCYPTNSWGPVNPDDIPMEMVVRILWYCLGDSQYLDRFIGFFAGARIASYDVLKAYLYRAFIKQ